MLRRVGPQHARDLGLRAEVDCTEAYNCRAVVGLITSKLPGRGSRSAGSALEAGTVIGPQQQTFLDRTDRAGAYEIHCLFALESRFFGICHREGSVGGQRSLEAAANMSRAVDNSASSTDHHQRSSP